MRIASFSTISPLLMRNGLTRGTRKRWSVMVFTIVATRAVLTEVILIRYQTDSLRIQNDGPGPQRGHMFIALKPNRVRRSFRSAMSVRYLYLAPLERRI